MDAAQLTSTTWAVWLCTLACSVALGAVLQASHFCTMGAISDAVLMQDTTRLKQWATAVAVAMVGFAWMHGAGWIDPQKSIYGASKWLWLSSLVGGALFGVGMVLASGCTSKTLVRLGAGNLKSAVVLLVMAVVGLATLKGWLAVWRVHQLEAVYLQAPGQAFVGSWLASQLGLSVRLASVAAAMVIGGALLCWALWGGQSTPSLAWSGAWVGAFVLALWWTTGVLGHGLEHPETLEEFFVATASGRMEAFSFTAPVAQLLDAFLYFSDGSKRWTVGMVAVIGVLLGAGARAIGSGTFRWESFSQRDDLVRHVLGGALMGAGGVIGMGCTIGQGLSGVSTLSWMSLLTLLSIGLGAWLTLTLQLRQTARAA